MAHEAGESIDLREYAAKKASGKMTLVKIGDATCLLSRQKYDPDTGAPGVPTTAQLNLSNIAEARQKLISDKTAIEASLVQLATLEADMNAELAK